MDEATKQALDQLLHYVIEDEEKDYDGRPNHIYRRIYTLAKWSGWDMTRYRHPEA
jgi:hypothetical protein